MDNNSIFFLISTLVVSAFLGSWHCGLMCGPIASFAGEKKSLPYYHVGRVLSYTLLGLICGWLGKKFVAETDSATKIILFSILASMVIVLGYQSQKTIYSDGLHEKRKEIFSIQKHTIQLLMRLNRKPSYQKLGFFGLGFCSLLLPCGWLYSFVVAAAATQSPWSGALVMWLFSISSIPALQAFPYLLRRMSVNTSRRQKKVVTLVVFSASLYSLFSHFFIS